MIPERITDEIYNNLQWEHRNPAALDEETEGYMVLGCETITAWNRPDGEPAVDNVTLYLQRPGENRIKILSLDADFIYKPEEAQDNASPIEVAVAVVEAAQGE